MNRRDLSLQLCASILECDDVARAIEPEGGDVQATQALAFDTFALVRYVFEDLLDGSYAALELEASVVS